MKIKHMLKWNWQNAYISLLVLYGIFIGLYLLNFIISVTVKNANISINGMSFSEMIMMLVMGIVLFPQSLRFGLGNGVSRRSVFAGFLIFAVSYAAAMAVLSTLLQWLVSMAMENSEDILFLIYGRGNAVSFSNRMLLGLCLLELLLVFGVLGYFIGGAYYRMGKYLRLGVSIGVPSFLFVVLPVGISFLSRTAQTRLLEAINAFGRFLLRSPWNLALILLVLAALFGGLSWLFIRRAPVKASF